MNALNAIVDIRKGMVETSRRYFEDLCSIWKRLDGEIVASQRARGAPVVGLTSQIVFLATGRPDGDEMLPVENRPSVRVWHWITPLQLTEPIAASIAFVERERGTWSFKTCQWCEGTTCSPAPWQP